MRRRTKMRHKEDGKCLYVIYVEKRIVSAI